MSDNVEWDNFSQQSSERDLGLQIGDTSTIFWVSRRQLADCSPVFQAMLYGEFKESKNEIVKLSEKDPEEILELLRCLFSNDGQNDEKKPIDEGNVEILLKLGDEYQIADLLASCSNFLKTKLQKSTMEATVGFIDLSIRYKLKDVVRAGLRRLCKLSKFSTEVLLGNQAFGSLPVNVRFAAVIISSIRDSRPTRHDLEEVDVRHKEYKEFMRLRKYPCSGEDISGYRCTACDYQECGCLIDKQSWGYVKCYVCHNCKMEYGKTDFVCKCIDPLIEAELEKLGL